MRKLFLVLFVAFNCLLVKAQVYVEIGLDKTYLFDLGQDLSAPFSEAKYSFLRKGAVVEIVEMDSVDMFHLVVKHKKKIGIVHIGALSDRSPLISFYPEIREKYYDNIKNGNVIQGMNEQEVNLTIGLKADVDNWGLHKTRWTYPNTKVANVHFYKGEVYQIGDEPFYSTVYDIQLVNVQKPENVKERFSAIESIDVQDGQNKQYIYEDEFIKINWIPFIDSFKFSIQNKSTHSIKLPWDEMAFIDLNGESKRILNGETRKINSDREQPQSVVPRNAKLSGYAVPYPQKAFMSPAMYCCPQELIDKGFFGEGSMIRILFPIIIQDVVNEYVFEFKFKNAFVIPSSGL